MFHSLDTEELFSVINFNLVAGYFRLIRVEIPGHGISPRQPDSTRLTWPSLAADIRELAHAVEAPRYFAGGFSQGACISAHMAVENTGLLGLALLMLPNIWEFRPRIRNTYSKLITRLEEKGNNEIMERIFKMVRYLPIGLGWQEQTAIEINRLMMQMEPESLVTILKGAILSDLPEPSTFRNIGIPVLTGAWTNDPNHPVSVYEEVNRVRPPEDTFLLEGEFSRSSVTLRLLSFMNTESIL